MNKWDKTKETKIYILFSLNNENNIRYVGKTCQSLKMRFYHHIHDAKYPKYNSKNNLRHILNWIKSQDFKIGIKQIDSTLDWEKGEELEKYYIKLYKEKGYNLCNHTIGGDGATPKFGSNNNNSKKVIQYSLTGNFIEVFNSRSEAEVKTGIKQSLICGCVNMKRIKSAGGFIWTSYKDNFPLKVTPYKKEIKKDLEKSSCKVSQYSKNGDFIKEYASIHLASKLNNLHPANVRKSSQNKVKTCGGFIWKRKQ